MWTATIDTYEKRADGLTIVSNVTFASDTGDKPKTLPFSVDRRTTLFRLIAQQLAQLNGIDADVVNPPIGPVTQDLLFPPPPTPDPPTADQLAQTAYTQAKDLLRVLIDAQALGLTVDPDVLSAAQSAASDALSAATTTYLATQLQTAQAAASAAQTAAGALTKGGGSPAPPTPMPLTP